MKRAKIWFPLLICVLCWLFFAFTGSFYLSTDNFNVALILNGYYGNPFSQYQHPLFCCFVWLLSGIFPFADMFTVTTHLLIFLELFIILYLAADIIFKKPVKEWMLEDYLVLMVTILFCVFLSAGLNLWRENYTVQAGSFLFIGWMMIGTTKRRNTGWFILGIVFISFGYMLRKEAGLLFIPFVVLLIAVNMITAAGKEEKKAVPKRFLFPCGIFGLLILSQIVFTSLEPYSTANRYNEARTALVDFPVKSWDDKDEAFSDIPRIDYSASTNWFYADTDVFDADKMEAMAEAGSKSKYELSSDGFISAVEEMKKTAWRTDVYMSVMVILCIMLTAWNLITQRSWLLKLIAALAILGAFVILLYFTIRGRAPLRVWRPVLFGVMLVELSIIQNGKTWAGRTVKAFAALLLSVLLYYSAVQVVAHTEWHPFQTPLTARVNVDDSVYEETCQDDALYIWPSWHGTIPRYFGDMGKLPTKRVIDHNISLGDWTSGQPYYEKFLERIGHPNPIRDLVEGKNTYLMYGSGTVQEFLRFHYDENTELIECGEIRGVKAYKVRRQE